MTDLLAEIRAEFDRAADKVRATRMRLLGGLQLGTLELLHRLIRHARQHFPHRASRAGMFLLRCQFRQRLQYKSPLRHSRMRNLQFRGLHHRVAEQQDVEIDLARTFRDPSFSPHRPFYLLQSHQQLSWK